MALEPIAKLLVGNRLNSEKNLRVSFAVFAIFAVSNYSATR